MMAQDKNTLFVEYYRAEARRCQIAADEFNAVADKIERGELSFEHGVKTLPLTNPPSPQTTQEGR